MGESWPDWISAIAALLTLMGAAVSWWRSNVSRSARRAAAEDRARAERAVDEASRLADATTRQAARVDDLAASIQATTDAVSQIASSVQGPTYAITRNSKTSFRINKRSPGSEMIEEVINRDDFFRLDIELPSPIAPNEPIDFLAFAAMGKPVPTFIRLIRRGHEDALTIELPR